MAIFLWSSTNMAKPTQQQTKAYLKKIGFTDEIKIDLETLNKIVEGHIFTFPFETISLHDADASEYDTSIEFNDMFKRLVNENRGGHCVVLNLMLQTMLKSFGFNVNPILADTLWKCNQPKGERSQHCASIVTIGTDRYLVDAGFGSVGLLSPAPLKEGVYTQFSQSYRIHPSEEYEFECQVLNNKKWESIYGITSKTASLKEYKKINEIQSNPHDAGCSFSTLLLCTKPFKEGDISRIRICNEKTLIYKTDVLESMKITTLPRLKSDMLKYFNIDLKNHAIRFREKALEAYLEKPLQQPKPILYQYKNQPKKDLNKENKIIPMLSEEENTKNICFTKKGTVSSVL